MEVAIDSTARHLFVAQCNLAQTSVAIQYGAATLSTQVEEGVLPLVAAMRVAVHAAVAEPLAVGESACREVLDAALLYLNLVPHLIAWLDESVGNEGVDAVGRDCPCERWKLIPAAIFAAAGSHAYVDHSLFACIACQLLPFLWVD